MRIYLMEGVSSGADAYPRIGRLAVEYLKLPEAGSSEVGRSDGGTGAGSSEIGRSDGGTGAGSSRMGRSDGGTGAGSFEVGRTEKGRPFFVGGGPFFSVSHSGNLWACGFCGNNCGLDIERIKKRPVERLARRFFSEREAEYVRRNGSRAFFDLWVRKEAVGKLGGEGVFSQLGGGESLELVGSDGRLKTQLEAGGGMVITVVGLKLQGWPDFAAAAAEIHSKEQTVSKPEIVFVEADKDVLQEADKNSL